MNNLLNVTFKIAKCTLILLAVLNTAGWVSGAEPGDSTTAVSGIESCIKNDILGNDGVYNKVTDVEDECHRWGLVWRGVLGTSASNIRRHIFRELSGETWAAVLNLAELNDDGVTREETRLPTIKELVRIFDFTVIPVEVVAGKGSLAVPAGDHHFRSYLQADRFDAAVLTGYLISSTYRNINGGETTPKILGVEIQTGKVVAFDQDLKLCVSLTAGGVCNIPDPADDVKVYAFKVRELP